MPSAGKSPGSVREVALVFLVLGLIGFGGPAAHVALMRRVVVVQRKWLPEDEFFRMFAACNLIPGPSSTELAIYLGYKRAGWVGLAAGGGLFILPAVVIMLFIGWSYERFGSSSEALGILYGIRAAVVGIVSWAIIDLGRRLLTRRSLIILASAAAGLSLIGVSPLLLIVGGGLVMSAAANLSPMRNVGPLGLSTGLTLTAWSGAKLVAVFLTFLKLGLFSFGSGYVLYAFLYADFVQGLHWLTNKQLVDAIAIGQATPGPVFTTATFLGYLFAGVPGALLATLAIFLPGFILVPMLDRVVRFTDRRAWAGGFVSGANAAAVGLVGAVTVQVARGALVDWLTVLIATVAFGIIWKWPLASPAVIIAAAAVGGVRFA